MGARFFDPTADSSPMFAVEISRTTKTVETVATVAISTVVCWNLIYVIAF